MGLNYLSVCSGIEDRYKAIGNAMTVNVVRAIGYKIEEDYLRERGGMYG